MADHFSLNFRFVMTSTDIDPPMDLGYHRHAQVPSIPARTGRTAFARFRSVMIIVPGKDVPRNLLALGAVLVGGMALAGGASALQTPPLPDGQDSSVHVGDIDIGYRVYGTGHPLVMIMGSSSTMELWEPATVRALASRFKVILFDNRGMGRTSAGNTEFSIARFADDTAAFMDAIGVDKAHVLGWSLGSMIAQELALRHPGKVDRLVLYAAHCDASMFPPAPEVLRKITDTSGTPEEQGMRYMSVLFSGEWMRANGQRIREIFYRPMGNISGENMGRQAMAIGEWKGTTDRLGSIAAPTLVLTGADDQLVPPANSRFIAGKIPGATLIVAENGGHGLMFQYPELFREKVIAFLE